MLFWKLKGAIPGEDQHINELLQACPDYRDELHDSPLLVHASKFIGQKQKKTLKVLRPRNPAPEEICDDDDEELNRGKVLVSSFLYFYFCISNLYFRWNLRLQKIQMMLPGWLRRHMRWVELLCKYSNPNTGVGRLMW